MLTSYVIDHDMNVQFHVQIHLGDFKTVHSSDQCHLILGLDHHFSSDTHVYLDKKLSKDAYPLVKIHSALVNS